MFLQPCAGPSEYLVPQGSPQQTLHFNLQSTSSGEVISTAYQLGTLSKLVSQYMIAEKPPVDTH